MLRRELRVLGLVLGLLGAGVRPAAAQPAGSGRLETDPRLQRALRLEDCIAIALENNIELRIARLDARATGTGVSEALGAFWPTLGFVGDRTNTKYYGELREQDEHLRAGTASVAQLLPLGTTVNVDYNVTHLKLAPDRRDTPWQLFTFNLTQPLLRGGGWRTGTAAVKGARYDTQASRENLAGTRLSVVQQVKAAYFEIIRQAKLIEVNEKAIERDQQLVAQSQSKLDAGLGTRRDVLSAEIIREQDRGTLVDAQTGYREALDVLARVLGLHLGVHRLEIADKDVDLDTVSVDESAWLEKAMQENPTVRAARITAERARLDRQVAGNGRLPQLDLSMIYNRFSDPDVNELIKDLNRIRAQQGDDPKDLNFTANRGWTALVTISYPLGNRSLAAAYRRARLLDEQAQRTLEDAERQVALEVRSAIRALQNNVERLGILRKNIEGARNKLEFASVNFQLGRASNLDVTDAQKDLIDAETDYVNEVIDYKLQLSRIEQLVGGF